MRSTSGKFQVDVPDDFDKNVWDCWVSNSKTRKWKSSDSCRARHFDKFLAIICGYQKKITHLEVSMWPHCFFHLNRLFTYLGWTKITRFELFFFPIHSLPALGVGQFSEGAFQRCGAVDAPPTFWILLIANFQDVVYSNSSKKLVVFLKRLYNK